MKPQLQFGFLHPTEHISSTEKESKHRSHPQTCITKHFPVEKGRISSYQLSPPPALISL